MRTLQIFLLVLCLSAALVHAQQDCNSTHLEYFSEYYLGRQDELNKTFTKIQEKIQTLNNVTWRVNDTFSYIIGGIKPKFAYLDTKQRADIVGHDTVIIQGGILEVTFDFQWSRLGTGVGGNGSVVGISDPLAFSFTLQIKDGFMLEVLQDWQPVRFNQNLLKITRITPPDIIAQDVKNLQKLMNNLPNVTTVKHELQDEIDKIYQYYLNQSLYDDKRIIDNHFDYEWTSSKGRLVIPFEATATAVDIEDIGIMLKYITRIKDYPAWKCEMHAPDLPYNPKVFGGIQEFVTYDVYRNTLRYAIDNGHLDVDLDRRTWQSRFFQFYAGDLYEVIPKTTQRFMAHEPVTGSCRTSSRYAELKKGGYDFLNVSMMYNCEIGVNRDKVMQFQVNLTMQVQGRANETNLDFFIINQTHKVTLVPYMDYTIANPTLAQHMITHSINRLHGHRVFGSGWPLYTRDYPHFIVEDNFTVVYDSTHVDPHNMTMRTE